MTSICFENDPKIHFSSNSLEVKIIASRKSLATAPLFANFNLQEVGWASTLVGFADKSCKSAKKLTADLRLISSLISSATKGERLNSISNWALHFSFCHSDLWLFEKQAENLWQPPPHFQLLTSSLYFIFTQAQGTSFLLPPSFHLSDLSIISFWSEAPLTLFLEDTNWLSFNKRWKRKIMFAVKVYSLLQTFDWRSDNPDLCDW